MTRISQPTVGDVIQLALRQPKRKQNPIIAGLTRIMQRCPTANDRVTEESEALLKRQMEAEALVYSFGQYARELSNFVRGLQARSWQLIRDALAEKRPEIAALMREQAARDEAFVDSAGLVLYWITKRWQHLPGYEAGFNAEL